MNTKYYFSKFVSIFVVLGLMFSNTGSLAYAQEGITPAPEPVSTELPLTEPPSTGSLHIEGQAWSQSGWFSVIWGDGPEGASQTAYTLTHDSGQTTVLSMDETLAQSLGGVLSFDRKYVSVQGVRAAPHSDQSASPVINVTSISLAPSPGTEALEDDVLPAVIGSKPWITIMCKFSNFATEPNNLAYFQGMYANTKPGLDHYWRELSYNTANVAGSNAAGWFVLPHTEAYYNPTDTLGGTNLILLATDCTAVADASVNFALYQTGGINMMFNTDFDNGYAWGGSMFMTLDGVAQVWSTTWEPPWAYDDISVIQHEMGHGFGLPHSSGNYGQVYDNAWDVMSKDRYNCAAATDPTYGCIAQHTISYHKDKLGWIPSGEKFTPSGGTTTITLEQLALPQTSNYKMAQIPIGGSATHFYTVEARRLTGYDIKLPGQAVIIHEVDTTREIPAHVIDPDNNGNTGDAGAMWTVGETFSDPVNGISIYVSSATSTGFQVSITTPSSGPPGAFNKTSPANGATGQPASLTLSWGSSSGVSFYEYCYDTTNDNACASWVSTGTTASANLSGLNPGTTYYWQVRANNANGTTYANGSSTAYWSFIVFIATNLLQDPSFEAYTPNPYWSEASTNYGTPLCTITDCTNGGGTAGPRTGSVWGWFGGTSINESGSLSQSVVFPNGSANLQFYLWIGAAGTGSDASDLFSARIDNVTVFLANATQRSSYPTYTLVSVDVSAFANGALHTVKFSSVTTGQTVNFNLDDVALKAVATFADVPTNYWAWEWIERLYRAHFTDGCSTNPLAYCPERSVTRAEMAIFLERGIHGAAYIPPAGTGAVFADVLPGYWALDWIEKLYADQITSGCSLSPLSYCPERSVTRAEMAVFLLKAKHGTAYDPPAAVGIFADVPTTYWAASWIERLYAEGITGGCSLSPLSYCPERSVTRAEMAVFLVTTFNLP